MRTELNEIENRKLVEKSINSQPCSLKRSIKLINLRTIPWKA
jgi:hypothetical protein